MESTPEFDQSLRTKVRLAILDDHELVLDGLASWVTANAPDFEVSLAVSSWLELVHSDRFPTDLLFLDFQLKESVSIEARVRTCRAAGTTVIVISGVDSTETRDRALAAGAVAFVSKTQPMDALMAVARTVMGVAPGATPPRRVRPLPSGATSVTRPRLSVNEARALSLYASGLSTVEVAERMRVQYETVKTYLRRVREKYAKVGRPASAKADLMRRAAEDGYLQ
ncbi:MAG: response regulator [Salinibacterium sp.]|nr:response regulator [Salinibacterium sp.]